MVNKLFGSTKHEQNNSGFLGKIRLDVIVCILVIFMAPLSEGKTGLELRQQIINNYNKSVSPGFEDSQTDVGVYMAVTRISNFDESKSILSMEVYLHVNWMDNRLKWYGVKEYENISYISLSNNDIWKPKMNVFNSGRSETFSNTEMPAFCSEIGHVWWTVTADVHPVCVPEDLRWYPTDTHTCKLSVGPLYPQEVMSIMFSGWTRNASHGIIEQGSVENPHWERLSLNLESSIISVGSAMYYPTDEFIIVIRRRGGSLLAAFIPLMLSCLFLSWSSFALPPRGEPLTRRLSVAIFCLFLSSSFLMTLIKSVPSVGYKPPIIVKVFTCVVFLVFFTCLHAVIMACSLRNSSAHFDFLRKLPAPVQQVLGLHKSQSAGAGGLLADEETPPGCPEQFQKEPSTESSWNLVAAAYDRVHVFLQVIVLILGTTLFCLV